VCSTTTGTGGSRISTIPIASVTRTASLSSSGHRVVLDEVEGAELLAPFLRRAEI
jgi:hypothetical protein